MNIVAQLPAEAAAAIRGRGRRRVATAPAMPRAPAFTQAVPVAVPVLARVRLGPRADGHTGSMAMCGHRQTGRHAGVRAANAASESQDSGNMFMVSRGLLKGTLQQQAAERGSRHFLGAEFQLPARAAQRIRLEIQGPC